MMMNTVGRCRTGAVSPVMLSDLDPMPTKINFNMLDRYLGCQWLLWSRLVGWCIRSKMEGVVDCSPASPQSLAQKRAATTTGCRVTLSTASIVRKVSQLINLMAASSPATRPLCSGFYLCNLLISA